MVRDPAQPTGSRACGPRSRHRRRILLAVLALLLSVAGVLEFGFEIRLPWLAMTFWMLAVVAVIVACSGVGASADDRS